MKRLVESFEEFSSSSQHDTAEVEMLDRERLLREGESEEDEIESMKGGYQAISDFLGAPLDQIIALGSPGVEEDFDTSMLPDGLIDGDSVNDQTTQIWTDKYWESSPGGNHISGGEFKGVKYCTWDDASGDGPFIYVVKTQGLI